MHHRAAPFGDGGRFVIFFAIEIGAGSGVRNEPTPGQRASLGAAGAAAGLGCAVVVSLLVLIGGGLWIDQVAGTTPVFTLIGVALGLAAAGYQLYELTRIGVKDREPGPLGRRLSRMPGGRPGPSRPGREE